MSEWNHAPPLPLFERPFNAGGVVKWYFGAWLPVSINLEIVGLAFVSLCFFAPVLEQTGAAGLWMVQIFLRNAVLVLLLAGGLHVWFQGSGKQGTTAKYDPRPFLRKGGMFSHGHQLCNTDIGRWSGLSMHPAEHVFCFGTFHDGASDAHDKMHTRLKAR